MILLVDAVGIGLSASLSRSTAPVWKSTTMACFAEVSKLAASAGAAAATSAARHQPAKRDSERLFIASTLSLRRERRSLGAPSPAYTGIAPKMCYRTVNRRRSAPRRDRHR